MADQNDSGDACNMEISIRPEPHLEATQDLELLAQEIAEAAVEEERRSSYTSSPTPSSQTQMSDSCEMISEAKEVIIPDPNQEDKTEVEEEETVDRVTESEETQERGGRSQSPVDEASWEIVDAEEEPPNGTEDDERAKPSEQNYSIVRKFIGSHDLWQKLKDIGMACDICIDQNMDSEESNNGGSETQHFNVNDFVMSCSESMVICDMPQEPQQADDGEDEDEEVVPHPVPVRDMPEEPKLPSWHGRIAGARVVVTLERLGGLLVASVQVNHTDLLSALASMQQLAASAGLVSYADVDVSSILARAA